MFLIRIVSHWFFVKLFLVLVFTSIRSSEHTDCPQESITQVKWQQTQNSFCTLSEPPCTNERMELSRRCCKNNGTWDPAPRCVHTPTAISNPCPETAHNHNSICIFIVQNTTYPPDCPYEETIPFDSYVNEIKPEFLPIWMPVVRQMGIYGIGPFYWIEASPAYKLAYSCPYSFECSTINNCLIYHNRTFVEAVSCNESHNAVCAYQVLGSKDKSFCSQSYATQTICRQSDYSTKSKCFCIGNDQPSLVERAEFLQPYQNLIYQSPSDEGCYIGLERQGDFYVWSNSNSTISYTNWATDAVFGEEYVFGGISSGGWIMTKSRDEFNCTLYQKSTIEANSEMVLTYDDKSTLFTLTLSDPKTWVQSNETNHPLIFCFTDASKQYVVKRIEVGESFDESSRTFSFVPLSDGPGNYWCEGFSYPEVEMKKSNEYMLKANTEEYIVILSTNYSKENNPLTEASLSFFQQLLQDNIDSSSVSTDSSSVSTDSTSLSTGSFSVSTDSSSVTTASSLVSTDSSSVTTDSSLVSTDSSSVNTDSSSLSTDSSSVSTDRSSVSTDSSSVSTDSSSVSTDSSSVTTERTSLPIDSSSVSTDLSSVSTSFYPRIFKVVGIEEEFSRITLNFHLTTTIPTAPMANYNTLRNLVANNLKDFRLENFLVADICLGVQVQSIQNRTLMTWPLTKINDVAARPREGWCVNDQGAVVNRLCEGNFIDGAQWSKFDGNCIIVNSTNLILNLTNILNNNDPMKYIDEVIELAKNHENFNPLVINLFSEFLRQVSTVPSPDMKSIVKLVNDIANTPVDILKESQMMYQATDKILDSVDALMKNASFSGIISGSIFSVASCNFRFLACRLYVMSASLLITFSNVMEIEDTSSTLSIILKGNSLNSNTANEDLDIFAAIYSHPSFFSEIFDQKNISMVISIYIPGLETFVNAHTLYSKTSLEDQTSCSNWKYEMEKIHGHWEHDSIAQQYNTQLVCEFPNLRYFGLVSATNVSYELERIMSPLYSMKEKSSRLASLLEYHSSSFKSPDIYLVAEIISGFSKPQEEELDSIADVYDKIVDIDKAILTEAVLYHNVSTGLILSTFDRLVGDYKKAKKIARKNFFVLLHDFSGSDIHGFSMTACENYCSIDIVNEPDEKKDNTEVDITLSPTLMEEMSSDRDSIMVVTVFSNNALFILGNSFFRNISSKVIGVRYPTVTANMTGAIEIGYRLDKKTINNYSCESWRVSDWEYRHITLQGDNGLLQCYVDEPGYTVVLSDVVNTTLLLEDIQNSNLPTKLRLQKTEQVLQNFHREFRITDIPLIAKVFEGVAEVDTDVLQLCVNIINIVMNIDREVLRESQNHFGATDQILFYLEEIAGRFKCQNSMHSFVTPNIALAIFPISLTGPVGVDITQCERNCSFTLDWENFPRMKSTISVNSKISLSKALRDEILYSTVGPHNVMVTSISNDAFFNEEQVASHIKSIVGFKIANYDAILKHEVTFDPFIEYSEENKCVYWSSDRNATNGNGSWVVGGQMNKDSTCRFLQQGYFSVLKEDVLNITAALEEVLFSKETVFDKLVKAEGISHFFDRFAPVDLHLLASIVAEEIQFDERVLDVIRRIGENFFAMSRTILIKSQIDYDVLNRLLESINKVAMNSAPNEPYTFRNKLSVLVCLVNSSIGFAFDGDLSCLRSEQSEAIYAAKLILSESLLNRIMVGTNGSTDPKFITTAFYDDDLFIQEKKLSASTIFGLSIPHFNGSLENDITLSYNMKEPYDYNRICAYWEYPEQNYGQWVEAHISYAFPFVSCGFGNVGYFSFVENLSENLTELLRNIQYSSDSFSDKLTDVLEILTENMAKIEPFHISIISEIFNEDEVTSKENLKLIGNITSMVMDIDRTILTESQKTYNATDWILHRVDKLLAQFKGDISLSFNNLAVIILSDMISITFKNVEDSWAMKVITSESSVKDPEDWDALLVLDGDLRAQMQQSSSSIYITVYFSDALFVEKFNDTTKNVGIIVGAKVPGVDDANLTENLQILFRNTENRTDICAYWNYVSNGGCIENTFQETNPVRENSMSLCEGRVDGTHLALLNVEKNITNELQDILNSTRPLNDQLQEVFSIVERNCVNMCPYDVYLIAQILAKVTEEIVVTRNQTILVSKIVSNLFQVQRSVLREAQLLLQATDKILQYLDEILERVSDTESSDPIIQDRLMITMYDLKKSTIFGFTLSHCTKTNCVITVLTDRISPTDIAAQENFNMALVLSEELRQQVEQNVDPVQLMTTIFFEDDLFNEKSEGCYDTSKICGILLPGLQEPLRGSISLIYNIGQYEVFDNRSCAFWDYLEEEKLIGGSWKRDISPKENGRTVICEFQHITHFVLLLADSDILDEENIHILDIITNINSVLSLFGLFGILLTAVLFDRWRNNTGNQILINFSLAISIKNVMLYISVGVWVDDGKGLACTITGGILHYSILSEFCWMLIIAILQFKKFVEVLGGPLKYVLLKACICGWVFPALPVFLIIMIDVHNYSQGSLGLCYPSGLGLYLAVWLPLLVIITINSVIFVFILYNVFCNKTVLRDQTNHEMLFQWRLALLLFFMLGLTWLFGFLGLLSGLPIFLGLFCFLATLQGFLMFLFFIVFNKNTRFLYIQGLRRWLYSKGYKKYYT